MFMNYGISTACLYPLKTEDAFLFLAQNGVKDIEIFFNSISELNDDFLNKILEIKEKYNVNIPAVHPFSSFAETYMLFSQYERRFEDTFEYYKNYYKAAKILGARFVSLHGHKVNGDLDINTYAQRYKKMFLAAKEYGVTLNQENVVNHTSGELKNLLILKDLLKENFSVTFDIKQCIRAKQDVFECIKKLGGLISHIHISDNNENNDCMLIGEGNFDFKKFVEALNNINYNGKLVLEVYRNAYKNPANLVENYKNYSH